MIRNNNNTYSMNGRDVLNAPKTKYKMEKINNKLV
jgi:hypothetical protein